MSTNNNHNELFSQMYEAITPDLAGEVLNDADTILIEQRKTEAVIKILTSFSEKHPEYAPFNKLLSHPTNPPTFYEIIDQVIDGPSPTSVSEAAIQENLLEVLLTINKISDAIMFPNSGEEKKELQVEVLTSDRLLPDQKTDLITVADQLLTGKGIDTSDPDDIATALAKKHDEDTADEVRIANTKKINIMFDSLFSQYKKGTLDLEYTLLRTLVCTLLAHGTSIPNAQVDPMLKTIGISHDDFTASMLTLQAKVALIL